MDSYIVYKGDIRFGLESVKDKRNEVKVLQVMEEIAKSLGLFNVKVFVSKKEANLFLRNGYKLNDDFFSVWRVGDIGVSLYVKELKGGA